MKRNPVFPPSLSSVRDADDPNGSEIQWEQRQHKNARLEQEVERRKKLRRWGKSLYEKPCGAFRSKKGAEARITGLLPVLESTLDAVKQQNTPATKGLVEEQLRKLVRQSDNLADHLAGMDREAIAMWA